MPCFAADHDRDRTALAAPKNRQIGSILKEERKTHIPQFVGAGTAFRNNGPAVKSLQKVNR